MGKTNKQKITQREERLKQLPRSERLAKQALIKRKEGRVLDAAEKHALKMTSEYGEIMRLWEQLRTMPTTDDRKRAVRGTGGKPAATREPVAEEGPAEAAATTSTTSGEVPRAAEGSNPKFKIVKQVYKIVFPKFDEMVKTPRVSRVLQSCVKYGSNDQLMKLSTELAKHFVVYATDGYAHHVVCALFRHVPHALYTTLLKLVLNSMPQLITHKFGMLVINAAYTNKLCSQADRNHVVLGVFKDSVAIMKSWPGYPVLERILANEGEHRKRLLTTLFNLVDKLVSQKEAYELPFVQRMVSAFIRSGTKSEVMELCQTMKPHFVKIMTSKEGSELASLVFALLQPKSRKDVLRQVSETFVELACDKMAAPVIARFFDLVYDNQVLYKFVSSRVAESMPVLMRSPYAHLIVLHLLTPDDSRKRRALFPSWFEHNLFSQENPTWNTHDWLDDKYNKETVEICSKDAQRTHVMVLPPIIRSFFAFAAAERDAADFPKHFVARVAKEINHLVIHEPLYAEAMQITDAEAALLPALLPNKEKRKIDEEGEGEEEGEGHEEEGSKATQRRPVAGQPAAMRPAAKAMKPERGVAVKARAPAARPLHPPEEDDEQEEEGAGDVPVERSARGGNPSTTSTSSSVKSGGAKKHPSGKLRGKAPTHAKHKKFSD